MNYYDKIQQLKNSPLFNLSLSSKELFHSNFIAWICHNYSFEFGSLLVEKFDLKLQNKIITKTTRESKNLDLVIEFEGQKLIIENKVKAIPDKQQLIDYKTKNNPSDTYILLTLIQPNFNLEEIGWNLLTYQGLSNLLNQLLSYISIDYHKAIITDYVNFITILFDLTNMVAIDFSNGFFDFYGEDYRNFHDVRLHDLYLKNSYQKLIDEIKKYLNSKIISHEIIVGQKYSHAINKNQIMISTTFVNGKSVVNIDYSNEDELIYGIMLDGNRYNQYIYTWGTKAINISKTADNLQNKYRWFKFNNIPDSEIYPKNGKKYNRFGDNMVYRSAKIKNTTTFSSLFEQIYMDLKKIL
ncbi:PD-(D/E)XK nuclease family protein [Chryseobacterium sp. M5]|uniref:PD-(D/E)XK nuclease family protein n=1 Tax=Chryseobacterium sp. M5 TaxID=3379128 RepID=UPI003857B871